MVLLITYDLHKPDRDYADVEAYIKGLGGWCHLEESVWLVDTQKSVASVRDGLKDVGTEATYFVERVTSDWASFSLGENQVSWLKSSDRRW
jgi:hypothetical protein